VELAEVRRRYQPAIDEIVGVCSVGDGVVDREAFQVYMATVWGNAALDPSRSGITEDDLPYLHDFLNEEITGLLGHPSELRSCYAFIVSKSGDDALVRLKISKTHKEFLHYFARLILEELA
jgi:hypothetical protein